MAFLNGILAATIYKPDCSRIRELARLFSRDRSLPSLENAMLSPVLPGWQMADLRID
jgi:hypothetical protein